MCPYWFPNCLHRLLICLHQGLLRGNQPPICPHQLLMCPHQSLILAKHLLCIKQALLAVDVCTIQASIGSSVALAVRNRMDSHRVIWKGWL